MRRLSRAIVVLMLAMILPAAADPPPAPWVARDIGEPSAPGSTDVIGSPPDWLWTLQGSGAGIFSLADSFHFAYRRVKGDASISARFRSASGGDAKLAAAGLMIRADEAPESPNLFYAVSAGGKPGIDAGGLTVATRRQPGDETAAAVEVGPRSFPEAPLTLRLQRVDNEITGFYSRDGELWSQAAFAPQTKVALPEEALFGLAVTSHLDGELTSATFDQVDLRAGPPAPNGVFACGRNRAVLLQWRPLRGAMGYQVYRGLAGARASGLVRITTGQVPEASFADMAGDLMNGIPYTYAVQGLFPGAGGAPVEGPLVAVPATPVALPPDWSGCSLGEPRQFGAAVYDPARNTFTVRGSGNGPGAGVGDELYFAGTSMVGDGRVTVTLTRPPNGNGEAMLMIRDDLAPGARFAAIGPTSNRTLNIRARAASGGSAYGLPATTTLGNGVPVPVTLRLVRQGDTITWLYSIDGGRTFRSPGPLATFTTPLPQTLFVGLAVTARNRDQVSEAEFANLRLE
jgi:hypothetical protein